MSCSAGRAFTALPGVEFDARHGTPLGGPFTTQRTAQRDLQRVADARSPSI